VSARARIWAHGSYLSAALGEVQGVPAALARKRGEGPSAAAMGWGAAAGAAAAGELLRAMIRMLGASGGHASARGRSREGRGGGCPP
jgi:hypothetical protein